MSGGGTGRGSGRAHFRSKSGCCICGTKSSSSRFTASQRYAEHFVPCFGDTATGRAGDLCNACVLCVKRWLLRGKQPGCFSKVVGSKRGPGPKRMKEITKRARRREAKQLQEQQKQQTSAAALSSSSPVSVTPVSSAVMKPTLRVMSSGVNRGTFSVSSGSVSSSSYSSTSTPVLLQQRVGEFSAGHGSGGSSSSNGVVRPLFLSGGRHSHNHDAHYNPTCVACWADRQNSSFATPATSTGTFTTRTRAAAARQLEMAEHDVHVNMDAGASGTPINGLCYSSPSQRRGGAAALGGSFSRNGNSSSSSSNLGYSTRLSCNTTTTTTHLSLPDASPHHHRPGGFSDETGIGSSRSGIRTSTNGVSGQMSLCDGYSSSSFNSSHHEFRSPHPPLYPALTPTTTASRGVLTRASAAMQNSVILHSHFSNYNNNNNCSTTCSSGGVSGGTGGGGASGCCFDGASSTASSTTSTPSTPTRRQNRRTRLPPIKISPDGVEVNDILRKIQKDSLAMNFDSRQINMAMQREIRLRNRIVSPPTPTFAATNTTNSTGSATNNQATNSNAINP